MFKLLTLTFLTFSYSHGTVIRIPSIYDQNVFFNNNFFMIQDEENSIKNKELESHVMDFINLIDLEKVIGTAARFIDDPEVLRFLGFLFGPQFIEVVWTFETTDEFREAYMFLETKGYDVESLINYVNSGLNLPPFNKPQQSLRFSQGVSGFIASMIGALPVEEMKDLLKTKLETSPEVADLFEVLHSPEFIDILKRLIENPKLKDIKSTFENYGLDFKLICLIAQEVLDDDYKEVFCGKNVEHVSLTM